MHVSWWTTFINKLELLRYLVGIGCEVKVVDECSESKTVSSKGSSPICLIIDHLFTSRVCAIWPELDYFDACLSWPHLPCMNYNYIKSPLTGCGFMVPEFSGDDTPSDYILRTKYLRRSRFHQNGINSYSLPSFFSNPSIIFIPSSTFSSSNLRPTTWTPKGRPCISSALYIAYCPDSMALAGLKLLGSTSRAASTLVIGRTPAV